LFDEQRRKHESPPSWNGLSGKREQVPLQIQSIIASHPEKAFNHEAPLKGPLAVPGTKADLQPRLAMLLLQVLVPWAQTEEEKSLMHKHRAF